MKKTVLIFVILLLFCSKMLYAQSPSTQGKEFWVTFMKNYEKTADSITDLSLMISAKRACSGVIQNPNTGWSTPFSVPNGGLVKIAIPTIQAYNDKSDITEAKGLYVTSTDTISLYAANYANRSFDIANVLPVSALAYEYIVQMYSSYANGGEFVIIADEDDTTIEITPTAKTKGGQPAGATFSITLNRGQSYQLITESGTADFSGTHVKSKDCKKIAVFNGNLLTKIPVNFNAGDHLFEQAIPIIYWGTKFAVTNTKLRDSDRVRITAARNNTQIKQNGSVIATINSGQFHEFELSAGSCFLETSEPSCVFLYLVGNDYGGGPEGDPSMLRISPIEQKIREITFGTYETNEIRTQFVNIVVATSDKHTVTIDGVNIGSEFVPLIGNPSLSYVQKNITFGSHTLRSNNGVIAHAYGLGYRESYAYSVGSAMEDLQRKIWIEDEMYKPELFVSKYFCMYDPVKLHVELSYPYQSIFWDFGDGQTATNDTTFYHQYTAAGTYDISVIIERITIDECSGQMYDTVTAKIQISDYMPVTNIYETVCYGKVYSSYGFTLTALTDTVLVDTIPTIVCDSLVYLHITVAPIYNDTIFDNACQGELYNLYGFNITPTTTGLLRERKNLTTIHGCDSIVTLELTVFPSYYRTINDTICLGGHYNQYNFDTIPTQVGFVNMVKNLTTIDGCDSVVRLNLRVFPTYNDTIEIIVCSNDSVNLPNIGHDTTIYQTTTLGCDSIYTIKYYWSPAYNDTIDAKIYIGNGYNQYGFDTVPDQTGLITITKNLSTADGCDSIITLILTIEPAHYDTISAETCVGERYNNYGFDTIPINTDTIFISKTDIAIDGYDSITTLILTVFPTYVDTLKLCSNVSIMPGITRDTVLHLMTIHGCDSILVVLFEDCEIIIDGNGGGIICENCCYVHLFTDTICLGEHYNKYNFDTIPTQPGLITYPQFLKDISGCDSLVVVQLMVGELYSDTLEITLCSTDPLYSTAHDTTMMLKTIYGCDSIVTLKYHFNPHPAYYEDYIDTICLGEHYNKHGFDTIPKQAGFINIIQNLTSKYNCDSIITLQLTIFPSYYDTIPSVDICLGERYNAHGFDTIPTQAGLLNLTHNFTTQDGCDSIINLQLNVHPSYNDTIRTVICSNDSTNLYKIGQDTTMYYIIAYGCDSIVRLEYYLHNAYEQTITDTICLGDIYNKNGFNFTPTTAGLISVTENHTTTKGCDSVINLELTVFMSYLEVIEDTICIGERYTDSNFDTIPASIGAFTQSKYFTTLDGCDSIITLNLLVCQLYSDTITDTICANSYYYEHGFDTIPTQAGIITYSQYLTSKFGCDSIITLQLTVFPTYHDTIEVIICKDENQEQTPVENPPILGDYNFTQTFTTIHGCDSSITIQYVFHPSYYDTIYREICLRERYLDSNFDTIPTQAGLLIYPKKMKTLKGCDSIITLKLMVNPIYNDTIDTSICLGEHYNKYNFDTIPTQTGFISQTKYLTTIHGCDSIVTLNLTVNPVYYDTIEATVCVDERYNQHGFNIMPSQSGFFSHTNYYTTTKNCDSILTLQLTVNPKYNIFIRDTIHEDEFSYIGSNGFNTPGTHIVDYKSALGCDSIMNLILHVIYYPTEITGFSPFNKDGVNDYLFPGFKVQIFNRYGGLIYETKTEEEKELGWDGRNNQGHYVQPGLYFYILYNSTNKPRLKSSVEVLQR